MAQTNWKDEFDATYAVPQQVLELIDEGLAEDLSWHNDECPSFGTTDEEGEVVARIWVEHIDPDLREHGADTQRFRVDYMPDEPDAEMELTDDVVTAVEAYKVARARYVRSVSP